MGITISTAIFQFLGVFFTVNYVYGVSGGETCTSKENDRYVQEYCNYGCCGSGNSEYCCSISTSVLVVACVVSGLILIALISAIVICCYKNYKDKQASRVRRLRQQEEMNAPRNPGAQPPKPPSYVSAPPAYSERMPESHFRPATATGNIPYNQRYRGTTPAPREPGQSSVSVTNTSGRYPMVNAHSNRTTQIPGAIEEEAPPPYTEYARVHTPAHRRRRFIRTPVPENYDNINDQSEVNNNNNSTEVTHVSETSTHAQQSRAPETLIQTSREETSRVITSRPLESQAVTTRAHESCVETLRENESRAESVARILRPSRISRIPTRVQGSQSRQLSDVSSRTPSVSTRGNSMATATISTPSASTSMRRNPGFGNENIEELAVI